VRVNAACTAIPSGDSTMLRRIACLKKSLSPLGERAARAGAFTSRRESGEGASLLTSWWREIRPRLTGEHSERDSSLRSE